MPDADTRIWSAEEFLGAVGSEVGLSRWFEVPQSRIDGFADLTEDWQPIHLDPEVAAQTPFGGTVAHGFLTLSLLSAMSYDALPKVANQTMSVNYGFDRLRFVSPVRGGSRLRARFRLDAVELLAPGLLAMRRDVQVEIEGADKPALAALWLVRHYFEER